MIKISVTMKAALCSKTHGDYITSGEVGKEVEFDFSDDWIGYAKTAVFEGSGVVKDRLLTSDRCVIPAECIVIPGSVLRCGIYGVRGDLVTPTIYCEMGKIKRGAKPSGDPAEDPTPELWQQALDAANQAMMMKGIPPGGKKGQFLCKQSDEDHDVAWSDLVIPEQYGLVTYDQDKTITIT